MPELPIRAELLAALSVAIDLGLGQPAEHMLRAALIATRLADRLGLSQQQRDCIYYTTLIMWIGCHADSHEYARWFGDDIACATTPIWSTGPGCRTCGSCWAISVGRAAAAAADHHGDAVRQCPRPAVPADPLALHIRGAAGRPDGPGPRCAGSAARSLSSDTTAAGCPTGAHGDAIPIQMRVAQLADMVEVHHRTYGVEGAVAMARTRRGGQFDPAGRRRVPEQRRASWPARRPATRGRRRCARHRIATSASTTRRWTRCSLRSVTSST